MMIDDRRAKYMSVKDYRDYINIIDTAHQKGWNEGRAEGLEEGHAKGLEEGRAEERLSNARSLKENGVPIEVIANSLGLAKEEIDKL